MKMGKLRLRRAKLLGQGLPASKTQSWGSNPGPSATGVLSHGSQLSCRKHGPSRPKRGDGPFGRYKWTTRPLALHPSGETFPWGGLASKGERQGPEPGALVPCPRHLQNLPARPQHTSPSYQAGVCRERMYGQSDQGTEAPNLSSHHSPVSSKPAICLSSTHPLSRPISSQCSHQGHLAKATLPTGHLP